MRAGVAPCPPPARWSACDGTENAGPLTASRPLILLHAGTPSMESVLADIKARGEFEVELGFTVEHGEVVES